MIVQDGQKSYPLTDRATEMVRFIISRMQEIEDKPNCKVEHNCAPNRIQCRFITFDSEARLME